MLAYSNSFTINKLFITNVGIMLKAEMETLAKGCGGRIFKF